MVAMGEMGYRVSKAGKVGPSTIILSSEALGEACRASAGVVRMC